MANANNPHGLLWLGVNLAGGACRLQDYSKVVGYGTAIFRGDVVNRVAGGAIQANITPGTTLITGVSLNYGAASTATTHTVIDTPDAIYEAQSGATGVVTANLGLNANLIISGAGSATTKMSGHLIDESTVAVTATLDLHLLKFYSDSLNVSGPYSRVEVVINKSRLANVAAGV
jgi:hypothetical protein